MPRERVECSRKILVAAFGSYLRGDDSFGIRLLYEVERDLGRYDNIDLLEAGTNGMLLVQQLLDKYDALIILDAVTMGGDPGQLYVMKVEGVEDSEEYAASLAQLHEVNPQSALYIAKAIGVLPEDVFIVGCEPANTDLDLGLSADVKNCMAKAKDALKHLVASLCHVHK